MDKNISINALLYKYKEWVRSNPTLVTDLETVATWSSYFIAGKVNKSAVVSEIVYSVSKLLTLYNDKIIRDAYKDPAEQNKLRDTIKYWITVIHFCEVFIELAASKQLGQRGKWSTVTILQVIKCSANLFLLYKFREAPIQHPPVPVLQRKQFIEDADNEDFDRGFFTLRRSRRVIRAVNGSPPVGIRDWQPVQDRDDTPKSVLDNKDIMLAETIHIMKPLIHLSTVGLFGTKSWIQWLVALGIDIGSLRLYKNNMAHLTPSQRLELGRRRLSLFLFLLRSPMYNKYSKNAITNVLKRFMKKMPISAFLCNPILHYMDHWQNIYFYMWAS